MILNTKSKVARVGTYKRTSVIVEVACRAKMMRIQCFYATYIKTIYLKYPTGLALPPPQRKA